MVCSFAVVLPLLCFATNLLLLLTVLLGASDPSLVRRVFGKKSVVPGGRPKKRPAVATTLQPVPEGAISAASASSPSSLQSTKNTGGTGESPLRCARRTLAIKFRCSFSNHGTIVSVEYNDHDHTASCQRPPLRRRVPMIPLVTNDDIEELEASLSDLDDESLNVIGLMTPSQLLQVEPQVTRQLDSEGSIGNGAVDRDDGGSLSGPQSSGPHRIENDDDDDHNWAHFPSSCSPESDVSTSEEHAMLESLLSE